MSNQRSHFRLEYPPADRPLITLGRVPHKVLDLSETGVKFELTKGYSPKTGEMIRAMVKFQDGKAVEVEGKVIRILQETGHCVLLLTKGIPLAKMLEEQRYLIQKYKA